MDWKLVSTPGHRLVSQLFPHSFPYPRQVSLGNASLKTSYRIFLKIVLSCTNSRNENESGLDSFKENTEVLYSHPDQATQHCLKVLRYKLWIALV